MQCQLGFLRPNSTQSALVYFGVQYSAPGNQKLKVAAGGVGDPDVHRESVTISVGS